MFITNVLLLLTSGLIVSNMGTRFQNYSWKLSDPTPYYNGNSSCESQLVYYPVLSIVQHKLKLKCEMAKRLSPPAYTELDYYRHLINKEADIIIYDEGYSAEKYRVVDFSSPIRMSYIKFLIKRVDEELSWYALFSPYTLMVWICLLIILSVAVLILPRIIYYDNKIEDIIVKWSWMKTCWFFFASLTNQGNNLQLIKRFPSRLATGLWLLFITVFIWGYTGILMSFMTAVKLQPVPTTFEELASAVKMKQFSCGTCDTGGIIRILNESKTEFGKILANHIIEFDNIMPFEWKKARERMQNGRFAFITYVEYMRYITYSRGKWFVSEDTLVTKYSGYMIRKGFPYKRKIDRILSNLYATGIISKLLKSKVPLQHVEDFNDFRPLSLKIFMGAFIFLVTGYILSIVAFIIELISSKTNYFK